MKRTRQRPSSSMTDRAVGIVLSDQGSHDSQLHVEPAIKRPCEDCGALRNERCASERYPSGRVRVYFPGFHASR